MTMLEKAARALAAEDARRYREETGKNIDLYSHSPDVFKRLARAVLMAVREPDDSVRRSLAGGEYTTSQRDRDDSYEYVSEKNVADFCRDMIDAILNEGQP
ncbi:hypothetical protein [uncultured Hyphomicrobium sp.]|uniref:hypothetical protein n=1 Tax=uncultured Hyphomicrobium sp. TaxID=194373 RepID=UPI0025F99723|nr:hypothetical protein [uncultured Hyphomicrobium sp.]